jgi:hypothetical protein
LFIVIFANVSFLQKINNHRKYDITDTIIWLDDVLITTLDYQDETIVETDDKTVTEARCKAACQRLANEAVLRLSADNVTVVLISIAKT